MSISAWVRISALLLVVALAVSRSVDISAAAGDYPVAQAPLFIGDNQPPLMMMVMSRDEQLFNKAYTDYTDLNEDGVLDTTYQNAFEYSGYFDPNLCYAYGSSRFKASGPAINHGCSSLWSGNFLNWVTMSRLDVLRYVMYGGQRSTDADITILERAHIPNDLHAWVKVYSGADIAKYVPGGTGTMSFCNATLSKNGAPQMRVASNNWSEWASTALFQCLTDSESSSAQADNDIPGSATNYTVRVEVCDPKAAVTARESFCQKYGSETKVSYKPVGLLQTYGESGRLRFGLVTGSYTKPRSGGMLRRNIGKFANNDPTTAGCAAGDEIDLSNGRFCHLPDSGAEGIVNTMSSFKLTEWNGWTANNAWSDCNDWGILNRQGQGRPRSLNNPGTGADNCSAWGNPLAEMYAEALSYIAGKTAGSTDYLNGSDLSGMPVGVKWNDPYRDMDEGGNSYCASCSILVMSSGLPSFDSDELGTNVPTVLGSAATATDEVGTLEGISGTYPVGRYGLTPLGASLNTHEDICSATAAKSISELSLVRGICPDIPSLEGSYLMSGLAFKANTIDMRPGLQSKPASHKNTATTYAVALADNLPKFDIPVGNGKITLSPLCQANASGKAKIADAGWRTCYLGSVGVGAKAATVAPSHVYGRSVQYSGGVNVAGSFSLVWEDSLWGNDHDNDVVSMMTYCVGAACSADTNPKNNGTFTGKDICWRSDSGVCGTGNPSVGANEVLVRIENLSAYAGNAMLTGFAVAGSNNDGVWRLALRPGDDAANDSSILTTVANPPVNWDKPKVMKFTIGTGPAKQLESPLWYAAKYGGFKDLNKNDKLDAGEWDSKIPGSPDNYFFARDPSKLKGELERIFSEAAGSKGTTGGGGAGARISTNSFTIDASFNLPQNTNDWMGDVQAWEVKADGSKGAELWSAAGELPAPTARNVFTVMAPTQVAADGTVAVAVNAVEFSVPNLGDNTQSLAAMGMPAPTKPPVWFGDYVAADLIAYLKGDHSKEVRNSGSLRNRGSALGDIINSTPEIVTQLDNYGYGYWDSLTATGWKSVLGKSYKKYLDDKKKVGAPPPMLYVGANDGMLHGFEATDDAATGGKEHFAFIPAASRMNLYQLADPAYAHRYYMDGAITSSDVAFDSDGDWHTVLVGSTGAGGRSVFGLDVSAPGSFDEEDVLWELAAGTGANQEQDLGYVMGKAAIVPVKNTDGSPRWIALFGNGANSENGASVLYAVDVKTGAVIARLKPEGDAYAVKNGLMNIAPIAFFNSDGIVDTVFGGDLQGNIWKFDLSDNNPANWKVAFDGAPLFTATAGGIAQPITGGVEVSAGPGGGVSLFFGTGRYFVEGDNKIGANPPVQSLYGIWDEMKEDGDPIGGRAGLVEQTVTKGLAGTFETRNVSRNPVTYPIDKGWYVDLLVDDKPIGERFIGVPSLQNGKVFFTSYEPGDADCSAGGGINWLYGLSLLTGGGGMSGVSNSPNGDSVCTGDCGAMALNKSDKPAPPTKSVNIFVPKMEEVVCDPKTDATCLEKKLAAEQCTFVLRAAGADPLYLPRPCGRQSWRQVR